jgi:hypothetical protein
MNFEREPLDTLLRVNPNVRDQRRRAVGAPLADRNLSSSGPIFASGMPTSADRCIALLDGILLWRMVIRA